MLLNIRVVQRYRLQHTDIQERVWSISSTLSVVALIKWLMLIWSGCGLAVRKWDSVLQLKVDKTSSWADQIIICVKNERRTYFHHPNKQKDLSNEAFIAMNLMSSPGLPITAWNYSKSVVCQCGMLLTSELTWWDEGQGE